MGCKPEATKWHRFSLFQGVREPAVAGAFYPAKKDELFEMVHWSFTHSIGPGKFPQKEKGSPTPKASPGSPRFSCYIVPHAGLMYSGPVAAHSYLRAFDFMEADGGNVARSNSCTCIVLGPNHYGLGSGVALSGSLAWETPLGEMQIDGSMSNEISEACGIIDVDNIAHSREHSIEVQIPFLQTLAGIAKKECSVVPICLMLQDRETAEEISAAIFEVILKSKKDVLIFGSSDLTHYESKEAAGKKDGRLLKAISELDLLRFYSILERLNVTACGYGAIATVMSLAKKLGMRKGELLKYATSGDLTGDNSSVVGYSSVECI